MIYLTPQVVVCSVMDICSVKLNKCVVFKIISFSQPLFFFYPSILFKIYSYLDHPSPYFVTVNVAKGLGVGNNHWEKMPENTIGLLHIHLIYTGEKKKNTATMAAR